MNSLFPLPRTLTYLDLSQNDIGTFYQETEEILGENLPSLPLLATLKVAGKLPGQGIGSHGDSGTVKIGMNLGLLQRLKHLDFSQNRIGSSGAMGTDAMGASFSLLTNLRYVDLSGLTIFSLGYNGSLPIISGLKSSRKLQTLIFNDLPSPYNFWDAVLITLADALHSLVELQTLGFSGNSWIYYTNETGLVNLINALPLSLQQLDFSGCFIGANAGAGANALAQVLPLKPDLIDLNLAQNLIGFRDPQSASNLFGNITLMQGLRSLYMQQSLALQAYIPFPLMALLRHYWQNRNNETDIYQLTYVQDVRDYFNLLGNNARSVNLSGNIANTNETMLVAIMEELRALPLLEDLDLSNNDIGISYIDSTSYPQFFAYLRFLPTLRSLNLASNILWSIGGGQVFADLGESLQNLTRLMYLNIVDNGLGLVLSTERIAVLRALSFLRDLEFLGLSSGTEDQWQDEEAFVLSDSLPVLKELRTLLIPGVMPNLNDTSSAFLLRSLPATLTDVDLSGNNLGGQGNLTGSALREALNSIPKLRTLNIAYNNITSTFREGEDVLNAMPTLICNGLQEVDLSGNDFSGDQWGSAANALEGLYSSQIQQACGASHCLGTPIPTPTVTNCAANSQNMKGTSSKAKSQAQKQPEKEPAELSQRPSGSVQANPAPKLLAIAAPLERVPPTSSAAPRAQPLGAGVWKAVKPLLSPSAWRDSVYNAASKLIDATCKAAFHLAVERDAATGQLVNAMPATFPNLFNPQNDWALSTGEKRELPLPMAPLVALPPSLPGPQPLVIAP
jgi:hypothetical protein